MKRFFFRSFQPAPVPPPTPAAPLTRIPTEASEHDALLEQQLQDVNNKYVRKLVVSTPVKQLADQHDVNILVGTYNVNGRQPPPQTDLEEWFKPDPRTGGSALTEDIDMVVAGFQEIVPLSASNVLTGPSTESVNAWDRSVAAALNGKPWAEKRFPRGDKQGELAPSMYVERGRKLVSDKASNFLVDIEARWAGGSVRSAEPVNEAGLPGNFEVSDDDAFVQIAAKQLVGVYLSIWVRKHMLQHVRGIQSVSATTGFGGLLGNKGAVAIRMRVYDSALCLVCAHMAAGEGQTNIEKRNADYRMILSKCIFKPDSTGMAEYINASWKKGTTQYIGAALGGHSQWGSSEMSIMDHYNIIWLGDLNYRLSLPDDDIRSMIKENRLEQLLEADQLHKEQQAGHAFQGWAEGRITFQPTFKYKIGTSIYSGDPFTWSYTASESDTESRCDSPMSYQSDMSFQRDRVLVRSMSDVRASGEFSYHGGTSATNVLEQAAQEVAAADAKESLKRRSPAWCDRILWVPNRELFLLSYFRSEMTASDHRPVSAGFMLKARQYNKKKVQAALDSAQLQKAAMESAMSPRCDVTPQAIDVGTVAYRERREYYITITNTATVDAIFYFVENIVSTAVKASKVGPDWLDVKPVEGVVKAGAKQEVTLCLEVHGGPGGTAEELMVAKDRVMDAILVLRVEDGSDAFINITGTYKGSVYGLSLSTVASLTPPPPPAIFEDPGLEPLAEEDLMKDLSDSASPAQHATTDSMNDLDDLLLDAPPNTDTLLTQAPQNHMVVSEDERSCADYVLLSDVDPHSPRQSTSRPTIEDIWSVEAGSVVSTHGPGPVAESGPEPDLRSILLSLVAPRSTLHWISHAPNQDMQESFQPKSNGFWSVDSDSDSVTLSRAGPVAEAGAQPNLPDVPVSLVAPQSTFQSIDTSQQQMQPPSLTAVNMMHLTDNNALPVPANAFTTPSSSAMRATQSVSLHATDAISSAHQDAHLSASIAAIPVHQSADALWERSRVQTAVSVTASATEAAILIHHPPTGAAAGMASGTTALTWQAFPAASPAAEPSIADIQPRISEAFINQVSLAEGFKLPATAAPESISQLQQFPPPNLAPLPQITTTDRFSVVPAAASASVAAQPVHGQLQPPIVDPAWGFDVLAAQKPAVSASDNPSVESLLLETMTPGPASTVIASLQDGQAPDLTGVWNFPSTSSRSESMGQSTPPGRASSLSGQETLHSQLSAVAAGSTGSSQPGMSLDLPSVFSPVTSISVNQSPPPSVIQTESVHSEYNTSSLQDDGSLAITNPPVECSSPVVPATSDTAQSKAGDLDLASSLASAILSTMATYNPTSQPALEPSTAQLDTDGIPVHLDRQQSADPPSAAVASTMQNLPAAEPKQTESLIALGAVDTALPPTEPEAPPSVDDILLGNVVSAPVSRADTAEPGFNQQRLSESFTTTAPAMDTSVAKRTRRPTIDEIWTTPTTVASANTANAEQPPPAAMVPEVSSKTAAPGMDAAMQEQRTSAHRPTVEEIWGGSIAAKSNDRAAMLQEPSLSLEPSIAAGLASRISVDAGPSRPTIDQIWPGMDTGELRRREAGPTGFQQGRTAATADARSSANAMRELHMQDAITPSVSASVDDILMGLAPASPETTISSGATSLASTIQVVPFSGLAANQPAQMPAACNLYVTADRHVLPPSSVPLPGAGAATVPAAPNAPAPVVIPTSLPAPAMPGDLLHISPPGTVDTNTAKSFPPPAVDTSIPATHTTATVAVPTVDLPVTAPPIVPAQAAPAMTTHAPLKQPSMPKSQDLHLDIPAPSGFPLAGAADASHSSQVPAASHQRRASSPACLSIAKLETVPTINIRSSLPMIPSQGCTAPPFAAASMLDTVNFAHPTACTMDQSPSLLGQAMAGAVTASTLHVTTANAPLPVIPGSGPGPSAANATYPMSSVLTLSTSNLATSTSSNVPPVAPAPGAPFTISSNPGAAGVAPQLIGPAASVNPVHLSTQLGVGTASASVSSCASVELESEARSSPVPRSPQLYSTASAEPSIPFNPSFPPGPIQQQQLPQPVQVTKMLVESFPSMPPDSLTQSATCAVQQGAANATSAAFMPPAQYTRLSVDSVPITPACVPQPIAPSLPQVAAISSSTSTMQAAQFVTSSVDSVPNLPAGQPAQPAPPNLQQIPPINASSVAMQPAQFTRPVDHIPSLSANQPAGLSAATMQQAQAIGTATGTTQLAQFTRLSIDSIPTVQPSSLPQSTASAQQVQVPTTSLGATQPGQFSRMSLDSISNIPTVPLTQPAAPSLQHAPTIAISTSVTRPAQPRRRSMDSLPSIPAVPLAHAATPILQVPSIITSTTAATLPPSILAAVNLPLAASLAFAELDPTLQSSGSNVPPAPSQATANLLASGIIPSSSMASLGSASMAAPMLPASLPLPGRAPTPPPTTTTYTSASLAHPPIQPPVTVSAPPIFTSSAPTAPPQFSVAPTLTVPFASSISTALPTTAAFTVGSTADSITHASPSLGYTASNHMAPIPTAANQTIPVTSPISSEVPTPPTFTPATSTDTLAQVDPLAQIDSLVQDDPLAELSSLPSITSIVTGVTQPHATDLRASLPNLNDATKPVHKPKSFSISEIPSSVTSIPSGSPMSTLSEPSMPHIPTAERNKPSSTPLPSKLSHSSQLSNASIPIQPLTFSTHVPSTTVLPPAQPHSQSQPILTPSGPIPTPSIPIRSSAPSLNFVTAPAETSTAAAQCASLPDKASLLHSLATGAALQPPSFRQPTVDDILLGEAAPSPPVDPPSVLYSTTVPSQLKASAPLPPPEPSRSSRFQPLVTSQLQPSAAPQFQSPAPAPLPQEHAPNSATWQALHTRPTTPPSTSIARPNFQSTKGAAASTSSPSTVPSARQSVTALPPTSLAPLVLPNSNTRMLGPVRISKLGSTSSLDSVHALSPARFLAAANELTQTPALSTRPALIPYNGTDSLPSNMVDWDPFDEYFLSVPFPRLKTILHSQGSHRPAELVPPALKLITSFLLARKRLHTPGILAKSIETLLKRNTKERHTNQLYVELMLGQSPATVVQSSQELRYQLCVLTEDVRDALDDNCPISALTDPHVAATALIMLLLELPEPIFPERVSTIAGKSALSAQTIAPFLAEHLKPTEYACVQHIMELLHVALHPLNSCHNGLTRQSVAALLTSCLFEFKFAGLDPQASNMELANIVDNRRRFVTLLLEPVMASPVHLRATTED